MTYREIVNVLPDDLFFNVTIDNHLGWGCYSKESNRQRVDKTLQRYGDCEVVRITCGRTCLNDKYKSAINIRLSEKDYEQAKNTKEDLE